MIVEEVKVLGKLYPNNGTAYSGRVYDPQGISNTVMCGGQYANNDT